MKAQVSKIGNSQGVRIPKVILEEADLHERDWVDLEIRGNVITLRPIKKRRQGWEESFAGMANNADDAMVDDMDSVANDWDDDQWNW